ncbi:ATPase [Candidatus Woesearchaeota archaeon]|nr:MAG: ATPase [Candidatus Woesearchaeota archaeon]
MVVHVRKYSGEVEAFSPGKLRRSLARAGATSEVADRVIAAVEKKLYEGISTKEIYRLAMRLLKKVDFPLAAKYDLKRGLMRLGPAGYAFEKYVAHILAHHGFSVETNKTVKGTCVEHEVDVVAEKKGEVYLVECKHHEKPWSMCRIQTALYVKARFDDVRHVFSKVLLVTNTKFSLQAIAYAKCAGVELLGWRYPPRASLEALIDKKQLWPISILSTLGRKEVSACIDEGLLLLRDVRLLGVDELKKRLKISKGLARKMLHEVSEILQSSEHTS